MKPRLLVFFLLIFCGGCWQEKHKHLGTDKVLYDLYPEADARQVNFAGAETVDGKLNNDEVRAIGSVIGRIPNIEYNVQKLWVFTADCPVSVRVQVKGYLIYLVKPLNSKWEVAGIREYNL